jgi:hypothetical protein
VKTNIVHTLFRVQKYGLMSIDQFTDILSPDDLKRCKKTQKKTWYSLPLNVFTNFTFQVSCFFLSVKHLIGLFTFQLATRFSIMKFMILFVSNSFPLLVSAFLFSLYAA